MNHISADYINILLTGQPARARSFIVATTLLVGLVPGKITMDGVFFILWSSYLLLLLYLGHYDADMITVECSRGF